MVRLGIGLYGIDPSKNIQTDLMNVATLKTNISQIKTLEKGETIGYDRKGKVANRMRIATVNIGYADGLSRRLGNGAGKMAVQGKLVPIIGNICMDMTMIDVTKIDGVSEGSEVIIFGSNPTVAQIADWQETIPYEVLTGISQRVKRVYFQE
jgi:alanine racemase